LSKKPYKWTETKLKEVSQDLIDWFSLDERNVFFKAFLQEHGIFESFICDYTKKYKFFKDAIRKAKEIQKVKIQQLALFNVTNTVISIYLLKVIHGMRDEILKDENLANLTDDELHTFTTLYKKALKS